jgi:hypothetical protein
MSSSDVRTEVVEEKHFEELERMLGSFLNSKRFCCCIPVGLVAETRGSKLYEKCPELMRVSAVAILPGMGVVGHIQVVSI